MRLAAAADLDRCLEQCAAGGARVAAVVFDAAARAPRAQVDWHAAPGEPAAYARELYALLRRLDAGGYDCIVLERPPSLPAWRAVNDRVGRAAAAFE